MALTAGIPLGQLKHLVVEHTYCEGEVPIPGQQIKQTKPVNMEGTPDAVILGASWCPSCITAIQFFAEMISTIVNTIWKLLPSGQDFTKRSMVGEYQYCLLAGTESTAFPKRQSPGLYRKQDSCNETGNTTNV